MPARRPPSAAGPAPATPLQFWEHRLKTPRARVQMLDAHLQGLRTEREEAATAFERLRAQARDALAAVGLERCRQPWLLPLLRTWLTPFLAKTPELQSGEARATVYLLAAGALTDSQLQLLQLRQQGATLAELGAQHRVTKEWIRKRLEHARTDAIAAVKTMCATPDSITILHRHEHPLAGLPTPMPDPPATPAIPDLPPGTWPLGLSVWARNGLELSAWARNGLLQAHVQNLAALLTHSPKDLLKSIGQKPLREIQKALARQGLALAPERSAPPATPVSPNLPAGTWPLKLSTRASNSLLMANVYSLDDLLTRSPQELLKVRNLGVKSLHELQSALASHGLTLAPGAMAPVSPQEGARPGPGTYRRQTLPPVPGPATPRESPNLGPAETMPADRTTPRKIRDAPGQQRRTNLTGKWLLEILQTTYPGGVPRRTLLDHFASVLISKRAGAGAKGRLARKMYARIDGLQRQGHVSQEEGVIRPTSSSPKAQEGVRLPQPGPILRKKHFLALLAEDSNQDGPNSPHLHAARWNFLTSALETGWSVPQAACALGITPAKATAIMLLVPAAPPRQGGLR